MSKASQKSLPDDPPKFFLPPAVSLDLLEDWLVTLRNENTMRSKDASKFKGKFLNRRSLDFLFALCGELGCSANTRYAAAELFDSFMLKHIAVMYDQTMKKSTDKKKDWKMMEDKIASQTTLRIFSCVQIASKLDNQNHAAIITDFNKVLRQFGLCYTSENILNSELRVLKTLDYHINSPSPLVYLETVLKLLDLTEKTLKVDTMYPLCLHLLDMVLLERDDIYQTILKMLMGENMRLQRYRLVTVQSDYILLACGIITAAAYGIVGKRVAEKVADLLHHIAKVTHRDVTTFAAVILRYASSFGAQVDPVRQAADEKRPVKDPGATTVPETPASAFKTSGVEKKGSKDSLF